MSAKHVVWFEILVTNIERAQTFYETVLATSLEALADPTDESVQMRMFPADTEQHGCGGALVQNRDASPGGSNVIYFACDDCSVEESRVEAAGGKVLQSKMNIGEYGFVSLIKDTEGNTVGLHSMQ